MDFIRARACMLATTLMVLLLVGCSATNRTVKPIQPGDVKALAGNWNGTFTGPGGTTIQGAVIQINPDGTYVARAGSYSSSGVTQVKDGKLMLVPQSSTGGASTVGRTSEATLYTLGDGGSALAGSGNSENGPFNFEVRK